MTAEKSKKQKTEEPKKGLTSAHQLMIATLVLVLALVGRAIVTGVHGDESTSRLSLLALEEEPGDLPQAFRNRDLPLKDLHEDLSGANLDKPRAYVELFSGGRFLNGAWGSAPGLKGAINAAYAAANTGARAPADAAFLVIPTNRTEVHATNFDRHFSNVHRGVRGAFIISEKDEYRLSPTRTVATNVSVTKELEIEAKKRGTTVSAWIGASKAHSFDARQFYIRLTTAEQKAVETLRGNRLINVRDVTEESTKHFTQLLSNWMFNNLFPDGRMTYMYLPSLGGEGSGNNMIRQWMGTVAMGRVAKLHPGQGLEGRAEQNIRYNLANFYKSEGDLGWIEFENEAKLGAAALAMISLVESPARASFAEYEKGLMTLTLKQWQPSGELRTFYKPSTRNDNHNFYPGETLLSWAFVYEQTKDPELLKKAMQSYRYYKKWHLENRNPAFIPWHTQAYYLLWKDTKDAGLRDWIFEMNDWLVDVMQTNSRVGYDDTIGRFYAPTEKYGVPHASSTGVYLEGLIDAFAMARAIGDKKHEEKYRRAIVYGLRSSMQEQFQDDLDMFYSRDREHLIGGVRTTVYDNEIRVDNVQHVLMGVQKILREFKASDYKVD